MTSLLQGAEELGIRKPLKSDFGGGIKDFVLEDQECFEGVSEERSFLTSQERQCIVNHMLTNLRAEEGEQVDGVRFLEGQPIGQSFGLWSPLWAPSVRGGLPQTQEIKNKTEILFNSRK